LSDELMVASNELIMIFLGLETLSISSYILLGISAPIRSQMSRR
jgi:NADH:ubiquinone oxidoreductase subunit 2 (subunit N)